ncbi:MAG: hypothetical protein COB59_01840 [Rhodospirillaceae bacterium]|nr:MAG: hypothetical protein COB59_01840 [Rhodospirillaceae bacterium]
MAIITISTDQLADIQGHGEQAYPQECCGLLVGHEQAPGFFIVTRIAPSPNMSKHNTKDSFEVDAQVRFDVMRALENTSDDIIGHYHSHPDHPAKPSETDMDMAYEGQFIWLITAINKAQAMETKAWRLDQTTRTSEPLTLLVSEAGDV